MVYIDLHISNIRVLKGCSPEWALLDQVVFSTVAALLYSNRTTSAIYSFIEQTIEKIRDSTCKNSRRSPHFVAPGAGPSSPECPTQLTRMLALHGFYRAISSTLTAGHFPNGKRLPYI